MSFRPEDAKIWTTRIYDRARLPSAARETLKLATVPDVMLTTSDAKTVN